jgi:signal transduction histidine kinase
MQNSVTAGAHAIFIGLCTEGSNDTLGLTVRDDGCGMEAELAKNVVDPFTTTRTTRKVGLGIPLLRESALRASGTFEIHSEPGIGTTVKASFRISHIDRIPLGDISSTVSDMIMANPGIDFELLLSNGTDEARLDTVKVKESLGEVPITNNDVLSWIREYIDEGIKAIFGGVLSEVDS